MKSYAEAVKRGGAVDTIGTPEVPANRGRAPVSAANGTPELETAVPLPTGGKTCLCKLE